MSGQHLSIVVYYDQGNGNFLLRYRCSLLKRELSQQRRTTIKVKSVSRPRNVSSPQEEELLGSFKWNMFEREQDLRITTFRTASEVKPWNGKKEDGEKVEKILEKVVLRKLCRREEKK